MSAFLYFSQDRRRDIKEANPGMRNTEISRILGGMWKQAPESERAPHIAKEFEERKKYKLKTAEWKLKEEERKKEAQKLLEEQQSSYPQPQQYPPHEHEQQPIAERENQVYPIQSQQYQPPLIRSESSRPPQPEPLSSQHAYYQEYSQEYYHPPPTYGPPNHYAGYQQPPQQHHHQPPQQAYHPPQQSYQQPPPQSYQYDYPVNEYQHRPDIDDQSLRTQNSVFPESAAPNEDQQFVNQTPSSEYASSSFLPYPVQGPTYHYDHTRPPSAHSFQGDEF